MYNCVMPTGSWLGGGNLDSAREIDSPSCSINVDRQTEEDVVSDQQCVLPYQAK